jgi:hypothetical protein
LISKKIEFLPVHEMFSTIANFKFISFLTAVYDFLSVLTSQVCEFFLAEVMKQCFQKFEMQNDKSTFIFSENLL